MDLVVYDDLTKIDSYLRALMSNDFHRTIEGQKDYEDLSVIEGEGEYSSYRIELPFIAEDFTFLKCLLVNRENLNIEKNKFLEKLRLGDYFKAVVKYISNENNKTEEDIKKKMVLFLDEMIELLFFNEKYKGYVLKLVNDNKLSQRMIG